MGYYSPLNAARSEIRILTLEPGHFENPVRGRLTTVSLHEEQFKLPTFNALSYVWGGPSKSKQVEISGHQMWITANLDSVLRHLRGYVSEAICPSKVPIWIDAICINQDDLQERSQQVLLMRDIYRQASRVLLWIGEPDEHTNWAMDRMNDATLSSDLKSPGEATKQPTAEDIRMRYIIDRNIELRRYWTRTWILQEVLLPRDDPLVLCGYRCVPWSVFVASPDGLPQHPTDFPEAVAAWKGVELEIPIHPDADQDSISTMQRHRALRKTYNEEGFIDIGYALANCAHLSATEPRDYVYGIFGLLGPEQAQQISVDYHKPAMKVFQDAWTVVLTSESAELDPAFIMTAFSFGPSTGTCPSWVPDLSAQSTYLSGLALGRGLPGWRPAADASVHIEGSLLRLSAVEFDVIQDVHLDINFKNGWGAFEYGNGEDQVDIEPLRIAESMAIEGAKRNVPGTDKLAAFAELRHREPAQQALAGWDMVTGTTGLEVDRKILWDILLQRRDIPAAWITSTRLEPLAENPAALRHALLSPLLQAIRLRCHNKRVFLTRAGFFGIGTRNIEAGDVITFIAGMPCLYVLRPFKDGYQMGGFAYVSGLMDWDVLDGYVVKSGLQERVINIY